MSYDVTKTIENLKSFNAVVIGCDYYGSKVVYDYRDDCIRVYDNYEDLWVEIPYDPKFEVFIDLEKIPLIKAEWEKERNIQMKNDVKEYLESSGGQQPEPCPECKGLDCPNADSCPHNIYYYY